MAGDRAIVWTVGDRVMVRPGLCRRLKKGRTGTVVAVGRHGETGEPWVRVRRDGMAEPRDAVFYPDELRDTRGAR